MSVDVEDYFHVSAFDGVVPRSQWDRMESRVVPNTRRLLDLFDEYAVRGTFFVLGWVAERVPTLVAEIMTRGHEVASHGYAHRLVYDQTVEGFRDDIRKSKRILEDSIGCRVAGYRAPSFSITAKSLWALDVLVEEGYEFDASIFPIRHDRYGIPDARRDPHRIELAGGNLIEFPGSTVRVATVNLPVSGGGYFRLLPYWWTKWSLSRLNRAEQLPGMFYLHPWEVDPEQPRLAVRGHRRFRHYYNLEHTLDRLRRLLEDFRFTTLSNVIAARQLN